MPNVIHSIAEATRRPVALQEASRGRAPSTDEGVVFRAVYSIELGAASGRRAGAMTLMALAADNGRDGEAALAEGKARGLDLGEEQIDQFVNSHADSKANA